MTDPPFLGMEGAAVFLDAGASLVYIAEKTTREECSALPP